MRDHDCNGITDNLEVASCVPGDIEVVGHVDTRDSRSVTLIDGLALVGAVNGIHVVDIEDPEAPCIVVTQAITEVRDIAVWGEVVVAATINGTVVSRLTESRELVRLAALDTGHSEGVSVSGGYAYVASRDGVYVVDISSQNNPVVVTGIDKSEMSVPEDLPQ